MVPRGSVEHLEPGAYYLTNIDAKFVRSYAIKGEEEVVDGVV